MQAISLCATPSFRPSSAPRFEAAVDDEIGALADERSFTALCEACGASGGVAWCEDLDHRLHHSGGASSRSLARLLASRQVLGFEWRNTQWVPMAQFVAGSLALRPEFLQVWSELAGDLDGWGVAIWFARCNARLGGRRPVDLLDGDVPALLAAARTDRLVAG